MENQKCTSMVCLDLSMAFDMINHKNSLGNPEKLLWVLRSCPSLDLLLSIKEKILGTNRPINLQDDRNRFIDATR